MRLTIRMNQEVEKWDPAREEDEVLILRYRDEGDVAALEDLVRRHTDRLLRYLRGMLHGKADVEDAFQEVWLRVVRRSDRYRSRCFRGWLLRIAHNVAVDHYRSRQKEVRLEDSDEHPGNPLEKIPSGTASPAREALTQDTLDWLAGKIRELPDSQREVFLMRVAGEMSFQEIAGTLRIPLNTALGRMHYAVSKLREGLAREKDGWSGRITG